MAYQNCGNDEKQKLQAGTEFSFSIEFAICQNSVLVYSYFIFSMNFHVQFYHGCFKNLLMQYILFMDIKIDWLQNCGFVCLTVSVAFITKEDIAL